MKQILSFAVLLVIFSLFSCKIDDGNEINYGTIEGKVYDSDTFEPISNVELKTLPPTTVLATNVTGYYQFKDLEPGEYLVKASKSGYSSQTLVVRVSSNKMSEANFILVKGSDTTNNDDNTDDDLDFQDKLVAYYKFDNNFNCNVNPNLDMTGRGFAFVEDNKGKPNSAVYFSGTYNSYAFTDVKSPFNLDKFSYSCWLKPSTGYGQPYRDYIDFISRWGHWGYMNTSFTLSLGSNGSVKGMIYELNNSDVSHASNYTFFETPKTISSGAWSHIVMTYANRNLKIYINGELALTTYSVHPQTSTLYGLMIGKRPDDNQLSFYSGAMDDLRVYKIALNDAQVSSVYNSGK